MNEKITRRAGVLGGGLADRHEDAGADDAGDPDRGEAERADRGGIEPLAVDLGLGDDCVDIAGGHFRILSECGPGKATGARWPPTRRSRRRTPVTARARASSRRSARTGSPSSTRCGSGASTPTRSASTATTPPAEIRERFADLGPGADSGERVAIAGRVDRPAPPRRTRLHRPPRRDREDPADRDPRRARRGRRCTTSTRSTSATGSGPRAIVVTSRRGELSVRIESFELLSKALRPLPDMRHGLTDPEARYRRRYLDLIVDDDSREIFEKRSIGDRRDPPGPARPRLPRGRDPGPARARRAARRRGRSSPTTTRSTSTCSCGSRSSCR